MKYCIAIVCACLLSSQVLYADIVLSSQETHVYIDPSYSWTVDGIVHKGKTYADIDSSSAQGTVIRSNAGWAGSKHENEEVMRVQLSVDGNITPITDEQSYQGNDIILRKYSLLQGAFLLHSEIHIKPDRLEERLRLTQLSNAPDCQIFYTFLGTYSNRLTEYAFGNESGMLYTGRADKNDGNTTPIFVSDVVAQYDPIGQDGVLHHVKSMNGYSLQAFIWDRSIDNKLYFMSSDAFTENDMILRTNSLFFEYTHSSIFFESSKQIWDTQLESLITNYIPEPASILLISLMAAYSIVFVKGR